MSRRTSLRRWLACFALAAGLAPASADAITIDDGHADYAARIVGGDLVSQLMDQSSGQTAWRDPRDVVIRLGASARVRLPRDGSLSASG
jgi:hypothetical protein